MSESVTSPGSVRNATLHSLETFKDKIEEHLLSGVDSIARR